VLDDHFLTLLVFSALVSIFFGTLSRESPRECLRVSAIMMASMVGVSLIVGWIMYLFPLG